MHKLDNFEVDQAILGSNLLVLSILFLFLLFLGFATPIHAQPLGQCATQQARGTPYSNRMVNLAENLPFGSSVVVMGDSIAARWPSALMTKIFPGKVVNLGVGGDQLQNTTWVLDHLHGAGVHAAIMVIGTNDIRARAWAETESCLTEKVAALAHAARAAFPQSAIYLFSVLPKGVRQRAFITRIAALNRLLRSVAAANGFHYVDVAAIFTRICDGRKACPLFNSDHIHPSEAGYEQMTAVLKAAATD